MKLIWAGLVFEILILALIKPLINDYNSIGLIAVLIHITFGIIVIMSFKNKNKFIFLFGYLARVLFMFWDLFARNIFVLPSSGDDSEMFYSASTIIANDLSMLGNTRGGIYSDLMGLLFRAIGEQRIVGQYINVLFGLSIVFVVYKILKILEIDTKVISIILVIAAFFPNSLIMSAIFLREIIPAFFVALSFLEYIKWYKNPRFMNVLTAIITLGIASMFHSGVIGIFIGYAFGLLFYDHKNRSLRFSFRTLAIFFMLIFFMSMSYTYLDELLLGKFRNVDEISDIYHTANTKLGGSVYLTSITINNPLQLLIFGPIKALYFLISPLPMNWRGPMDIFTFLTDSSLYLFSIYSLIKNRYKLGDSRNLTKIILWIIIGASFIFGIGVANAGTAVRHRHKLISLFLILLGVTLKKKCEGEEYSNVN